MGVPQRLEEHLVVCRCAIRRRIAVPRGDVDAELHAALLAGIGQLAQHIALAVAPRTLAHGVRALRVGPQTEAVVMLGSEDDALESRVLGHRHPLVAVEGGGVEDVLRLRALAPLQTSEGVGSEVAEHIHLHPLPGHLRGRGHRPVRGGRILRQEANSPKEKKQKQGCPFHPLVKARHLVKVGDTLGGSSFLRHSSVEIIPILCCKNTKINIRNYDASAMTTVPLPASILMRSPFFSSLVAPFTLTMAGSPYSRATTAPCDRDEPISVIKPLTTE